MIRPARFREATRTESAPTGTVAAFRDGSAGGRLVEALAAGDGQPSLRFKVRVIQAGLSGNNNFYPDRVLREAVPLINGARVFVKSDADHLRGGGKDVRNLVGALSDAAFVEGAGPDRGAIDATLTLIDPTDPITSKLREAVGRGMADLFGLSIDADGRAVTGKVGGKPVRVAEAITKIHSVDLIVEPGAGGRVISMIEALDTAQQGDGDAMRHRLIEAIKRNRPQLLAGKDVETLTDDELEALFTEALAGDGGTAQTSAAPVNAAPVRACL